MGGPSVVKKGSVLIDPVLLLGEEGHLGELVLFWSFDVSGLAVENE